MRIDLASRCSPLQRLQLNMINMILSGKPGPIITFTYKRNMFGKHFAQAYQEALRKATQWSKAELELFAAFVSKQNECQY